MRKKRGILGKIVTGVIVLGIIGAVFGGKGDLSKENPVLARQEQQAQEILPGNKAEVPKAEPKVEVPKAESKPAEPKAEAPKEEPKAEVPKAESKPAEPKAEETQPVKPSEPEKQQSSGIRKELKDFLDSYESFMDEYCEFMENYNASDFTMLAEYMQLISKYSEFADKADKWQSEDMNNEELVYYTEVLSRVSVKLLKASQNI